MVFYFAYGSNMLEKQMKDRGCSIKTRTKGILYNFEFKFNKRSKDKSGKANIQEKAHSIVEGVIYDIDSDSLQKLASHEKGYHEKNVQISVDENLLKCITFVADEETIDNGLKPKKEYKETIVQGARDFHLSISYVSFLEKFEVN